MTPFGSSSPRAPRRGVPSPNLTAVPKSVSSSRFTAVTLALHAGDGCHLCPPGRNRSCYCTVRGVITVSAEAGSASNTTTCESWPPTRYLRGNESGGGAGPGSVWLLFVVVPWVPTGLALRLPFLPGDVAIGPSARLWVSGTAPHSESRPGFGGSSAVGGVPRAGGWVSGSAASIQSARHSWLQNGRMRTSPPA